MTRPLVMAGIAVILTVSGCSGDDAATPTTATTTIAPTSTTRADVSTSTVPATTVEPTAAPVPAPVATVVGEGSVLAHIDAQPELAQFARLAHAPGIESVFTQERGVTVFAPDDDHLLAAEVDGLLADPNALATFVSRHLFIGTATFDQLGDVVTTAAGDVYPVDHATGAVGGTPVTTPDVAATNGVVHVLAGELAANPD